MFLQSRAPVAISILILWIIVACKTEKLGDSINVADDLEKRHHSHISLAMIGLFKNCI